MPSRDPKFAELCELLESKKGDFKRHYKIQTAGALSAYDIVNSPRVAAYLQSSKDGCAELTPGKFDGIATKKRLDMARAIARNKELQNKDSTFSGVALDALKAAEAILTDARKCRAYAEWLRDQEPEDAADDSEVLAERALRLEEERKRKQLERKLEEAQARARQAEIDKERLQREAAEREEEEEKQPASTPGWADVFSKIIERAASGRAAAAAPAPAPTPQRQIDVSGAWASADGFHYEFYQSGNAVRMVVKQFAWGPVITDGQGTISGGVINVSYQAMTPMGLTNGQAQAHVSADGRRIQGYYQNFGLGIRGAVDLYR